MGILSGGKTLLFIFVFLNKVQNSYRKEFAPLFFKTAPFLKVFHCVEKQNMKSQIVSPFLTWPRTWQSWSEIIFQSAQQHISNYLLAWKNGVNSNILLYTSE